MASVWYHLRVSVDDADSANGVIEHLIESFPLSSYIFAYEEKDSNHHFHGHIKYEQDYDPTLSKNKVKRSEFFKKMKKLDLVIDKPEASYHEVCRDEFKNLSYIVKECHILKCVGIDEDMLEEAKTRSFVVEEEKNTKMKDQLLNSWKWRNRLFVDKMEAFMFIDSYHVERDYLPPNFTNKIQYSLYIIYKLQRLCSTDEFYKLVSSLNGIKPEDVDRIAYTKATEYDNHIKEDLLNE